MNLFNIRAVRISDEFPRQKDYKLHTHSGYEVFCFISGDAMYNIEGNMYSLFPGDILLLNNTEAHHLILNSSTPYERITIHFQCKEEFPDELTNLLLTPVIDRPIGKYNLYSHKEFADKNWQYYLDCICKETNPIRQQVYLMTLLFELSDAFPLIKEQNASDQTNNVLMITHYIERHLTESLSVEGICDRFFISETQLTRQFKKVLGTTASEYILSKRLLRAYNLINEGVKPTVAYLQCGFKDYSSFYRAYKKKFGRSPKNCSADAAILERIEFP